MFSAFMKVPAKFKLQTSESSSINMLSSNTILSFDLNYMSKEISLVTDTELGLYDIESA